MESQQQSYEGPKKGNEDASVQPDAETLNTTDPQEHMKGPVSSPTRETVEGIEGEDSTAKTESGKQE